MPSLLAAIPPAAFCYVLLFAPLFGIIFPGNNGYRVFWPLILSATFLLLVANSRRLDFAFLRSPSILGLTLFLVFASASAGWAYRPEFTMTAAALHVMMAMTFILPYALKSPAPDITERLHWCYLISLIVNAIFILNSNPDLGLYGSYKGYFLHKQYLGMAASATIIFSLYELRFSGRRRLLGLFAIALAIWIIFISKSKGPLAFLILAPIIAALVLMLSKKAGVSLLIVLGAIFCAWSLVSYAVGDLPAKLSYNIYGDSTFTSRTLIWDFAETQAAYKPWWGWGFKSFWIPGPDSIAKIRAPSFIADMPAGHSGYLDTRLETGYIGYALLLFFVFATLRSLDHIMRQDAARGWLFLTLVLFTMLINLTETVWFTPFDPIWATFLIIVAEGARASARSRSGFFRSRFNPLPASSYTQTDLKSAARAIR